MSDLREAIRQRAIELGFDDCRFTTAAPPVAGARLTSWLAQGMHGEMNYLARNAAKRLDPALVLPDARSIIILAASYAREEDTASHNRPEPVNPGSGQVARYARFQDYHDILGGRLRQLAAFIGEPDPVGTRSLWYVDTGPLLERELAQRAGLGFIGKHTNLISRRLGNWLFLAEILTTVEVEPDPPETNRCGSCARCLAACPTGAIIAPFSLDARRCISYLTIELKGAIPEPLRPAIGNRIYGCDDCLAVCPWNRFSQEGALMKSVARRDVDSPGLLPLLALDDAGFARLFAGTPMLRAKRRGFLRNVCVALGNVGDRDALPALERAATGEEALVAEHARWAIQRIEMRHGIP